MCCVDEELEEEDDDGWTEDDEEESEGESERSINTGGLKWYENMLCFTTQTHNSSADV